MDPIGVIHGRFQILHVDHMEYLLAGKKRCEHLLVGIANPDISMTKYSDKNPQRSSSRANPLTYYERFQMIRVAMLDAGVNFSEFDIVPFPINYPELLYNFVPLNAKYYMTINDEWGREKQAMLESLGCDIEVMWTRLGNEKGINATDVRKLIYSKGEWAHLVPKSVYKYIIENGIDKRIQRSIEGANELCS